MIFYRTLMISNDESLCPTLNKDNYCLTGDVINRDAFPDDYQLEYQGFMEGSGYYWERQTFDVCYGYYGVSGEQKALFDNCISSLKVIKVFKK